VTIVTSAGPSRAREEAAGAEEPILFQGYRPVQVIYEHLDGAPFRQPRGAYYDRFYDELFVVDSGNGLIAIYDDKAVPKFTFSPGREADYPVAVATSPDGRIFVLNAGASEIAVFNFRGEPLRRMKLGEEDDEEVIASGMEIGPDGLLYILDGGGGRILVHDVDGTLVRVIRARGRGGPRLRAPYDLALDAKGNIYVSDRRGTPVQVYDQQGKYLRGWGKREMGQENFSTPSGITVSDDGLVLVTDPVRQDIKVFDSKGLFLGNFGGFGSEPGQFGYPTDVVAGPRGRLHVVERVGRRVQVFERIPAPSVSNRATPP
jgi:DNA-binding beta-propeller fold protein YncE